MRQVIERLVEEKIGDAREVQIERWREGVTRFANSEIHQNVEEENVSIRAIVTAGQRVGVASDNRLDAAEETLRRAFEIAELSPEIPDFPGLAPPERARNFEPFDRRLLGFDAGARAEAVKRAIATADREKLTASGLASLRTHEVTIANSNGLRRASRSAQGGFIFLPYDDRGSGYVEVAFDGPANLEVLSVEAVERASRSRDPIELQPGTYPVVLDTWAVADLVGFAGVVGLSALAIQEKRSFLDGCLKKKVFSERVTIVDDPFAPENPGYPFDWEGTPKAPLTLFDRGVFRSAVYDRRTAAREKRASTGHGFPPPNPWGPMPMNLVVRPGRASLEQLAKGIRRGVFVTRFHYTNVVDPRKGILTGMTRDGTFLIEKGRLMSRGVKNLRFTQGLAEAFSAVSEVGARALLSGEFFKVYAPAMRFEKFAFTSATKF